MSALRTHPKVWLKSLLDSLEQFVEFTPALDELNHRSGDEVVTGVGQIGGRDVAIIAHNNLSDHGYITSVGARKILRLMDRAEEMGVPIVSLISSPGVSIKEGIIAGDGYAQILRRTCELSGIVPQYCAVMGVNVGGPAYSASLQDITVFNRLRSHMMVSAPNVVKSVIGEDSTLAELGGSQMHAEITGLAHFVESNVDAQISRLKALVEFFPSNHLMEPDTYQALDPYLDRFELPMDPKTPFSAQEFLQSLLDRRAYHEYNSRFGPSILTVWGYIGGFPVGLVMNNSEVLAGSLNIESSEKASRFIRICDSYQIPVVTLIDTPGFMPGKIEEQGGLLRSGARLCRAMQTSVPRVSVVLRKNYGAAAIVLTQTEGWGGDLVLALDQSSSAIMGFSAAKQAIYGVEDHSADQLKQLEEDYKRNYEDPKTSYRFGHIDEMFDQKSLRQKLIVHLAQVRKKRSKERSPVRGIEP